LFGLKSRDILEHEGHAVADHQLRSRAEPNSLMAEHRVETPPQTFVGGRRIGGIDDLLQFLGGTARGPVVRIFAPAMRVAEWFIAFSLRILAILKLRDIDSFSTRFLGYDLLAQRVIRNVDKVNGG
jgi:hypothetical protein